MNTDIENIYDLDHVVLRNICENYCILLMNKKQEVYNARGQLEHQNKVYRDKFSGLNKLMIMISKPPDLEQQKENQKQIIMEHEQNLALHEAQYKTLHDKYVIIYEAYVHKKTLSYYVNDDNDTYDNNEYETYDTQLGIHDEYNRQTQVVTHRISPTVRSNISRYAQQTQQTQQTQRTQQGKSNIGPPPPMPPPVYLPQAHKDNYKPYRSY